MEHLRDLAAHGAWADAVFFHAWGKSPARDSEELRERVSHFAATHAFFLEVLQGEHALPWDRILRGEVRPPWLDEPLKSFEALREGLRRSHDRTKALLDSLDEAGLRRPVTIPWFPDPPCVVSAAEALTQVALHTQHHRGQCMTRLKALGGEPKNVDYLIWLWKGRPEPRYE